jgi:hypothetical protein
METFFNLAWLAVAIAGVSMLLHPASSKRSLWIGLLALICAVLLLYPAISISDDLHQQTFIAEDSTSVKKVSAAQSSVPLLRLLFLLLSAAGLFSELRRSRWGASGSYVPFSISLVCGSSISDRAPPALSVQQ